MPDLYETDILAWSEQQAGALRELATRRDLPNALDLAHVLEEISGVGLSELNAVKGFIRLTLVHALKCHAAPDAQPVAHWLSEIASWQSDLADRVAPSMRRRIDLDVLWRRAIRQAELDLAMFGGESGEVPRALRGSPCPIGLDDILSEPADPSALVKRLSASLTK